MPGDGEQGNHGRTKHRSSQITKTRDDGRSQSEPADENRREGCDRQNPTEAACMAEGYREKDRRKVPSSCPEEGRKAAGMMGW